MRGAGHGVLVDAGAGREEARDEVAGVTGGGRDDAEGPERAHYLLERMVDEQRSSEVSPIQGVDILIHDAQYTPHDYNKKRGWGHSCYVDTVNLANAAGVR